MLFRTLFASLVALLVAGPGGSAAQASPAAGEVGKKATFGLQPATDGNLDGRPALNEGVTPGATFLDHVAVINSSLRPYRLAVYATDAVNDDRGGLTLLAPGTQPTDAGSWITLGGRAATGHVTVAPRSFVVIPVAGRVPADATPGDHVAGIVADLTTVTRRNNVNVQLHQRVGLRAFVRVAGEAHPALAVEGLSVDYHTNWNPLGAGWTSVSYRLRNVGNVALGAQQRVAVSGLLGETATATPPAIALLLPGGSVDVRVPLAGVLPEIRMTAEVVITPVVPEGAVVPDVRSASASTSFWAVPWALIGTVVALAAGAVGYWRRRRTRPKSPGRHSTPRSGQRAASTRLEERVPA